MASLLLAAGGAAAWVVAGAVLREAGDKWRLARRLRDGEWTPLEEAGRVADAAGPSGVTVKLHGAAGSDRPLACELAKDAGDAAVVHRVVLGRWVPADPETYVVQSTVRSSPYFLAPEGAAAKDEAARVYVRGWEGSGMQLRLAHEHVEPSGHPALLCALASLVAYPLPFQHVHREYSLPLGTDVVAVGNIARARDGRVVLRPPRGGMGVLAMDDEHQIADRLSREASLAAVGGLLLGGAGTVLLSAARR